LGFQPVNVSVQAFSNGKRPEARGRVASSACRPSLPYAVQK
jgi:hypothetical protein